MPHLLGTAEPRSSRVVQHRALRPAAANAPHLFPAFDSFCSLKTVGLGSFYLLRIFFEPSFLLDSGKRIFHKSAPPSLARVRGSQHQLLSLRFYSFSEAVVTQTRCNATGISPRDIVAEGTVALFSEALQCVIKKIRRLPGCAQHYLTEGLSACKQTPATGCNNPVTQAAALLLPYSTTGRPPSCHSPMPGPRWPLQCWGPTQATPESVSFKQALKFASNTTTTRLLVSAKLVASNKITLREQIQQFGIAGISFYYKAFFAVTT